MWVTVLHLRVKHLSHGAPKPSPDWANTWWRVCFDVWASTKPEHPGSDTWPSVTSASPPSTPLNRLCVGLSTQMDRVGEKKAWLCAVWYEIIMNYSAEDIWHLVWQQRPRNECWPLGSSGCGVMADGWFVGTTERRPPPVTQSAALFPLRGQTEQPSSDLFHPLQLISVFFLLISETQTGITLSQDVLITAGHLSTLILCQYPCVHYSASSLHSHQTGHSNTRPAGTELTVLSVGFIQFESRGPCKAPLGHSRKGTSPVFSWEQTGGYI